MESRPFISLTFRRRLTCLTVHRPARLAAVALLALVATGCRRSPAATRAEDPAPKARHEETFLDEMITVPKDKAHQVAGAVEAAQQKEHDQAQQLRDD